MRQVGQREAPTVYFAVQIHAAACYGQNFPLAGDAKTLQQRYDGAAGVCKVLAIGLGAIIAQAGIDIYIARKRKVHTLGNVIKGQAEG